MAIMTHAKFHFDRVMLTLVFAIWASEPWRTTEKAGPYRVKVHMFLKKIVISAALRIRFIRDSGAC